MSKTIPSGLLTHYAQQSTAVAHCIVITRADAVVLRFTSLDVALTVSGNVYTPCGLNVSGLASTAGLAVNNAELQILPDPALGITRADLITGKWDHAAFSIFALNWANPADGVDTLMTGTLGEVKPARGMYTVELRSLTQALQQPVGFVTQKTCRARLGDSRCTLNLAPFTVTGTLTGVTSNQVFTDTARTEADGWFAEGELTWLTGANAGYRHKVKAYAADVFTLSLPAPFTVAIGDTYSAIAGCQKRHITDCKTKFNNILNFWGEPDLPGVDALVRAPVTSV